MADESEKSEAPAADASAPAKKKSKLPLILSGVLLHAQPASGPPAF